jgi:hypothetical protein
MSSALAIGAAMRAIADQIDKGVVAAGLFSLIGAAQTTVRPPDLEPVGDSVENDHLNLFLYTVTTNSGWRNTAATRNPAGFRIGRPPLGIDLHFMLSAYGSAQYHRELLLGVGMQVLYEQPFLDRNQIRALLNSGGPPLEQKLATAQLDQQIEQIKISPHDLSADELYKLWSAFGSKCRPSACYVATVVLIESKDEVQSAPPVTTRNLGVVPYEPPSIDQIQPAVFMLAGGPQSVVLTGSGFQAPGTMVVIGSVVVPFDSSTATSASLTVPLAVLPGPNLLQVIRQYPIGQPPAKMIGQSSPVAFVVQPSVGAITTPITLSVQQIVVAVVPNCGSNQSATLLLNQTDAALGTTPHTYAIDAVASDIAGATIAFDASSVASGTYLVRLRIDGTESVPDFDPALGFTGPTVVL